MELKGDKLEVGGLEVRAGAEPLKFWLIESDVVVEGLAVGLMMDAEAKLIETARFDNDCPDKAEVGRDEEPKDSTAIDVGDGARLDEFRLGENVPRLEVEATN